MKVPCCICNDDYKDKKVCAICNAAIKKWMQAGTISKRDARIDRVSKICLDCEEEHKDGKCDNFVFHEGHCIREMMKEYRENHDLENEKDEEELEY